MKPLIPLFYYPLKILFVDDDVSLLVAYEKLALPNKIETSANPQEVVQQLRMRARDMDIFHEITQTYPVDLCAQHSDAVFSFTFDTIKKLIRNNEKYDQLGFVFADYQMPLVNGLDLLRSIPHSPIMKILFTGEATLTCAVSDLNDNVINYFLQKGEATSEKILDCIQALQLKYFRNLTSSFLQATGNKFAFLRDAQFSSIMDEFIKKNNVTEYFLLNNTGCFFLQNKENKFIFHAYTDIDLDEFVVIHEHLEPHFLEAIKKRELIPHFEFPRLTKRLEDCFYPCLKEGKYYVHTENVPQALEEKNLVPLSII